VARPSGGPTGNPKGAGATCAFTLTNTGRYSAGGQAHPEDVSAYLKSDVYRLSAAIDGRGWTVVLPTELTSAAFGRSVPVRAVATASGSSASSGRITLTARSESDPSRTATATCRVDK
jgi:hypothetical protein